MNKNKNNNKAFFKTFKRFSRSINMTFETFFQPCCTCGDYHFKKVCTAKDLKINLLVRQINQKSEVIKQNMKEAWDKLEYLEQTYNGMLMKTHRLQSNRICLQVLSGEAEDGHPDRVSSDTLEKSFEGQVNTLTTA